MVSIDKETDGATMFPTSSPTRLSPYFPPALPPLPIGHCPGMWDIDKSQPRAPPMIIRPDGRITPLRLDPASSTATKGPFSLDIPGVVVKHDILPPSVPDIVETQGRGLRTRPNTPVPRPTPYSDAEFVALLRRRLNLLVTFRQYHRRRKYGDDVANEWPAGRTPVDVRERWISSVEEEKRLLVDYPPTDEEEEEQKKNEEEKKKLSASGPRPRRSKRRRNEECDDDDVKSTTASSNMDEGVEAIDARKRRRMG